MKTSKIDLQSLKIPLVGLLVFVIIGLVVWYFRHIMYFYLFSGIGFLDFGTRILIQYYPKSRQFFRLALQALLGFFLLFWIGLVIGVNFQFPEIFFDIYSGVVTGALIQLIVARIVLPFFFGNAFCSRACWSGFFFEIMSPKKKKNQKVIPRSNVLAWAYLLSLIVMAFLVAFNWDPGNNIEIRKWWIIGENIFIIVVGFGLSFFIGSRAYCRMLCPFITISGLIAPYSLFKITPFNASNCIDCMLCDEKCPMLIPVHSYVIQNKRIDDATCIVCERCVSACNKDVLKLTTKEQLSKYEK